MEIRRSAGIWWLTGARHQHAGLWDPKAPCLCGEHLCWVHFDGSQPWSRQGADFVVGMDTDGHKYDTMYIYIYKRMWFWYIMIMYGRWKCGCSWRSRPKGVQTSTSTLGDVVLSTAPWCRMVPLVSNAQATCLNGMPLDRMLEMDWPQALPMLGDVGRLPRPAEPCCYCCMSFSLIHFCKLNIFWWVKTTSEHSNYSRYTCCPILIAAVQTAQDAKKCPRTRVDDGFVLVHADRLIFGASTAAKHSTTWPQLSIRTQLNWLIRTYYFGKLSELRICEALATSSSFNPTFAVQRWNVETCGSSSCGSCTLCHRSLSLREKPISPRRST